MGDELSEKLSSTAVGPFSWRYTERDVIFYNLSLGCHWHEQRYVNESSSNFGPLPTLAVIPAYHDVLASVPVSNVLPKYNPAMLLHGEQYLEMHAPLPPSGTLLTSARVLDVQDKGKAAVVVIETVSRSADSGKVIAVNEITSFMRGAGGFGKQPPAQRKAAAVARNAPPERPPDATCEETTSEDLAALYRLNGDYNPLHIDPDFAAMGGFHKPILHGLCSFGVTGKHVLNSFAGGDPAALKSIKGRFAKHVFPGETLRTEMWVVSPRKVVFHTKVMDRDTIAITNAAVEFYQDIEGQPASKL
ncbi:g6190 [Coccomyxa elongata]